MSHEQTEKMKLEVIEKALHFNPQNAELMQEYLATIPNVHPSDKVMNLIEEYISRDPCNYNYWRHLIDNHQSSSSCDAENARKLYEKAFKTTLKKAHDSDPQMLQIFKSCCLFLRQCGLNEQFFAVIHLMMSININGTDEMDKYFYTSEIQNSHLIEYEDLVLKSDLPMNEVWFRMETLRAICNFLPVKSASSGEMEDPQRFVFNEDICNLVNPLKNPRAYNFDLFIIIMQLLKVPLSVRHVQTEIFTINEREMECGMDFLSILLQQHTFSSESFQKIFYNTVKDLNIAPNFLNFNVEHEPFLELVSRIIIACSNAFTEQQNKIVLILWLRFQRLIIIMDQLKIKIERKEENVVDYGKYKKQIKSKVKMVLKNSKHQQDPNIYCEYAKIESALGDEKSGDAIMQMALESVLETSACDSRTEIDLYNICMEICESMLLKGEKEKCLQILKKLTKESHPMAYFATKIDELPADDEMDIEDYFLPKSNRLNLIKSRVYMQLSINKKESALDEIRKRIEAGSEGSWLKEQLYQLYAWTFNLKLRNDEISNTKSYLDLMSKALNEFPRNIFILHTIAGNKSLRWFDLRKVMLKRPSNESIFYLVLASKYREEQYADQDGSMTYKHRIYNTIDGLVSRRVPGISSILTWRLYLRAGFNYDFSKCKRILYQTLEKFPMLKQIYLDGAKFLPEEHSQLLDLIIEKGLRAHALAEELEILRSHPIK